MNNRNQYWDTLAQYGIDASVIDPNDTKGYKNRYIKYLRDQVLEIFLASFQFKSLVLDFGAGTGNATRLIKKKGHYCVGVDISKKLLNIAKQADAKCEFTVIDGHRLPFKARAFDAAFSYVVFSYVIDNCQLINLLLEIKRILKPNAKVLFIEQTGSCERIVENGMKKIRTGDSYLRLFGAAGWRCYRYQKIRSGYFPLIYLIRYGLVPDAFFPLCAKLEVPYQHLVQRSTREYYETAFYLTGNDKRQQSTEHL